MSIVVAAAIGGCASIDSRPHVATGAATATSRLGKDYELAERWSEEWSTPPALPAGGVVRLADVETAALRCNRALRIALTSIASADAALLRTRTPPNPMVAFAFGFPLESEASSMVALAVMQQIAWLGGRRERIAAGEARLRAVVLDAADLALSTAIALRGDFAEIVALEEVLDDRRAARMAAEGIALRVAREVEAGVRPESDRTAAMTTLADAIRLESETAERLAVARIALASAIGAPDWGSAWTTDGRWPEPRRFEGTDTALAATRLDVLAAAARHAAAASDAEAAGLSRISSLSLGVAVDRDMSGDRAVGPAIEFEIPLFDAGDARSAEALAALERARLEADATLLGARREIATLVIEADAARERLERVSGPLRAAFDEEVRRVALGVGAGQRTTLELEEARMRRAEAGVEVLRDRLALVRAELAMERSAPAAPDRALVTGGAP